MAYEAKHEIAEARHTQEIVIHIEEKWHIDLLSSVSSQLQHLTLSIRSNNSNATDDREQKQTNSDDLPPLASDRQMDPLIKAIENMEKLTKLRIQSAVCGTFRIRSLSLEHLVFQGALILEECSCPRLKIMDISFAIDGMKDDNHIIFKELPRSVEELTLRIDDSAHIRNDDEHSEDNVKNISGGRYDDYEDEIQRLMLQKMVRLKRLQLMPADSCSFAVSPPSPKSVCDKKEPRN